jgi:lysophospholipase L1-like esterase
VPGAPVLAWPGTTLSVVAEGPELRARFREAKGPFGTSMYQVLVDGREQSPPIALPEGESTVLLAKLGPGPHRVDVVKRTEAMSGTTTFLGFDGATLSAPPPPRRRAIEIVGDSNTTAYGVDGDGPRCKFSPATQNFLHGYAWKLGLALDADISATAYSGKGIVQNYARDEKGTLPEIYPLTNPFDATSAAPPPRADAVVLFAGGNDYSYDDPQHRDPPADRVFADAYARLLRTIRAAHPKAPIVCVVTPAVADADGDHARTTLESNIRAAILLTSDPAIFFVAPAQADASEQTGCDYHPNPGLHDRLAVTLAKMIEHAAYSTRHSP